MGPAPGPWSGLRDIRFPVQRCVVADWSRYETVLFHGLCQCAPDRALSDGHFQCPSTPVLFNFLCPCVWDHARCWTPSWPLAAFLPGTLHVHW